MKMRLAHFIQKPVEGSVDAFAIFESFLTGAYSMERLH